MPNNCFYLLLAVLFVSTLTACSSDSELTVGGRCGQVLSIVPGEEVIGILENGDCTAEVVYPDQSGGDASFLDEYSITLPANGILTITMASESVNPFLFLVSTSNSCSDGCSTSIIIKSDDDSGAGQNAFITMDLAAGTYGIQANALGPTSGAYSLQTTFTP